MRGIKKLTAAALSIALMLTVIPMSVIGETGGTTALSSDADTKAGISSAAGKYKVVCELEEKREADTKYFLLEDGTEIAAKYDKQVHYLKDGKWLDVNNGFCDDESSENELTNKAADYSVKFVKKSNKNKLATVKKDKYKVDWSFSGANKSEAIFTRPDGTKSTDRTVLKNITGTVKYTDILKSTDIVYTAEAANIKEDIILKDKSAPLSFTSEYSLKNLDFRQTQNGDIEIFDSSSPENTVFFIDRPYMYDAEKNSSDNIEVSVKRTNKGFSVTLTPDREWLLSEDRVYPVTIDPSLISSRVAKDVWDIDMMRGQANNFNYKAEDFLVGVDARSRVFRSVVWFKNLPAVSNGDTILNATVAISAYRGPAKTGAPALRERPGGSPVVNIHRVTGEWPEQTNWNETAEKYDAAVEDYFIYDTTSAFFYADVTELVSGWYNGTYPNYGIMLKSGDETTANRCMQFTSSDWATDNTEGGYRPSLIVNYRNTAGLEDYWSYTSGQPGRNLLAYINNYNGNLVLTHSDYSFNSDINGFTLSHIYNSSYSGDGEGRIGNGWKLNLVQRIDTPVLPDKTTIDPRVKFVYTDGDGTKHYLVENNGAIVDEDGLGYTYNAIDETVDSGTTPLKHQLTTKDKTVLKFDIWGYLRRIIDVNGNTISLNYSPGPTGDKNHLTQIVTSSGGAMGLVYDSEFNLTSVVDNVGRVTTFSRTSGDVTKITYPDGTVTDFTYLNHRVTSVVSTGLGKCEYAYDARGRVNSVKTYGTDNTLGSTLSFTYDCNQTKVTEADGRYLIYQFDSLGRVTCVYDNEQNIYSLTYTDTVSSGTGIFANNKLKTSSNGAVYVNNLLKNGCFSAGMSYWSEYTTPGAAVSTEQSFIGSNSIKIVSENEVNARGIEQQGFVTSPGKTYTLSGYVRTEDVVSQTGHGASLEILTTANRWIYPEFLSGSTDTDINSGFKRLSATVKLAENENILRITAGLYNASGTVYLNGLQLEEGDTANHINLVSNSGFEYNSGFATMPFGYNANFAQSGDEFAVTQAAPVEGSYAFRINPDYTADKNAFQEIKISGKKGDAVSFGGWGISSSIPTGSNGREFAVKTKFLYKDGSTEEFKAPFNHQINYWQFVSKTAIANKDFTGVNIYVDYAKQSNIGFFDSLFLYKDTAQSYNYDSNGNVITSSDYAKQQSQFEYSNDKLSKLLNPSGSSYEYGYDENNNLKVSRSSEGIQYNISYDLYGNPISTVTSSGKNTAALDENKSYYIRNALSGLYMTVENAGTSYETNVCQNGFSGAEHQQWRLEKVSDGSYMLRPQHCNTLALDVYNFSSDEGANIQVHNGSGNSAQCFKVLLNGDSTYRILTKCSDYKSCVEVYNFSTAENGNVSQWTFGNGMAQKWYFEEVDTFSQSDNSLQIRTSATYDENSNHMTSLTDQSGNTTHYGYNSNGLLTSITDAKGNTTSYTLNPYNDRTESVTSNNSTVNYQYNQNGSLSKITSPSNTQYSFTYDPFGRVKSIKVGSRLLSQTNYKDNRSSLISEFIYGNGNKKTYAYDNLERLVSEHINGTLALSYVYDKQSNLARKQDHISGVLTEMFYDLSGRLNSITATNGQSMNIFYDNLSRVSKYKWSLGTSGYMFGYNYGQSNIRGKYTNVMYGVSLNNKEHLTYTYDSLLRRTERIINTNTKFVTSYAYEDLDGNATTTRIKSITNGTNALSYDYDSLGNITAVYKNGSIYESYEYDALSQLVKVTRGNDEFVYTYDNGGNIQSVKKNGEVIKSYAYGDSEWKDLLTQYNGEAITYDEIGNPLTYRNGYAFTWSNGRQLTAVTKDENAVANYVYDGEGNRISKTVNGVTTNYYYMNGVLRAQKTGSEYIIFLYDENGSAYGILVKNGEQETTYYYIFNAQGDIIGIVDENGDTVVEYTYTAWGEVESITGTLVNTIGQKNPLRYRGYYYDSETGFYYLSSRYYDPEFGRFINPDGEISDVGRNVLGYNLFAYCFNNPINMDDPAGQWPKWLSGTLNVVSGVAQMTAGAALGAFTSWTGIGAVAAGFLTVNGAATVAQGTGQIVNYITNSNMLREDNIVRTGIQEVGRTIGGDNGAKVAGGVYDISVVAASLYSGNVGLQQTGLAPIKVNINKVLNNPIDEFVTCGPAPGVISDYCRSIPLNGYGKIYVTQLPNGFYQLANGHHRVAALRSLGKETIKIFLTK